MRLLYTFLKDLKQSFASMYIYIEIMMALIFVAIIMLVVPENFSSKKTVYYFIEENVTIPGFEDELASDDETEMILMNSRKEVENQLADKRSSIGLVLDMKDNKLVFDYILQGYEDEKFKRILETSILNGFASEMPGYESTTEVVTLGKNTEKLSDRVNMLPVFLAMNSGFMGLFIIATYIFMDKDEGTIKAFAVTPSRVWEYLLSKMMLMCVSGLITGLITVVFVVGTKVHYLAFILLLAATNAFGTALGLFIASFFDGITKAMGWLYMTIVLLGFAAVSYYMPAFSPLLIKLLPTYPMLFAFRETLYDQMNQSYVYLNIVGFFVAAFILFLVTNYRFKKTLTV